MSSRFPRMIGDYTLPNCLRTLDDYERATGSDLPDIESFDLFGEEQRLPRAIGLATGRRVYVPAPGTTAGSVPADSWLRWRLREVRDELSRRRLAATA